MGRIAKTIECHYVWPELAAAFLVTEGAESYFVETNTAKALPHLLTALKQSGLTPYSVKWVVITHVHLDHAAGTSALLEICPNAKVIAHPRAARHLIDPSKLVASAKTVYGEKVFAELYGEIRPIAESRIHIVQDGERVPFASSYFECFYTRGHANHHHCIYDPALKGVFTGDSFGLAYPSLQRKGLFIFPSSSPTDFDPLAAKASLDLILGKQPEKLFLTHFGEVKQLQEARVQMLRHLDFSEKLYNEAVHGTEEFKTLRDRFEKALRGFFEAESNRVGLKLESADWKLLEMDLRLNADGIAFAGIKARNPR